MDAIKSTGLFTPPAYQRLLAMTSQVQSRFILKATMQEVFEPLLADLLRFTGSEYGFIGHVLTDPMDGSRFVRLLLPAGLSGGDQLLDLRRPGELIEAPLTSGRTDIRNGPAAAPPNGALPGFTQPLQAYLGVPLFHGGELAGLLGLANRPGGYEAALVDFLEPLFAAVGAIIGAMRIDNERRAAEEALRASEERLQATFELAAVGICHTAPDGRFLRVNRQLCDILGYGREALLGMTFHDVTLPEDLPADIAKLQQLVDGQVARYHTEKRYRHANGHVVRAQLNVAAVRDGARGPVRYFIAVVEDITSRREAENALLAAQTAERANAAKTQFLSRMSHELRTPLNAVLGFAQLLQMNADSPLSPSQQQQVRHIWNAGSHLLEMINDVLDVSRVEGGHLPVSEETIALPEVVDEAVALVHKRADDAGIRLQLQAATAQPQANEVIGDRLRLRQVLVNLLSNAVKYNRPGGQVRVAWAPTADGRHLAVVVEDDGLGMTPAQMTHLFEPFNRLGAERSTVEGTGLGLVLCKGLVQLMGGTLSVQSAPGEGSRFTIELPAAAGRAAVTAEVRLAHQAHTLLYLADDPMHVGLVREILRRRPLCRLLVARNEAQALSLAQEHGVDLLLLDAEPAQEAAWARRRALRLRPPLASLPCIVLAGGPAGDANALPATAWLTKPLTVELFLQQVDAALGGPAGKGA
jgi:PAS domain S-box-containing protein